MAAFAGLSVCGAGASRSSILRESCAEKVDSVFNGKMGGRAAAAVPWAWTSWKGYDLYAARGSSSLDAYNRGSRGAPAALYARDRVVSFGKNKGSMLGTLSSRYLRWMTKNLKGTMLDEWADYAQEVLNDPLYMDRIEWEKVEKLLVQSHDLAQLSNNRDALAPARMYGWDLDNEHAWSRVNFALLGTTKGGQIPRKPIVKEPKTRTTSEPIKKPVTSRISKGNSSNKWASTPVVEGGSLRDELDRRRQVRRERLLAQRDALLAGSKDTKDREGPFPGREGLLGKLQEKNSQQ